MAETEAQMMVELNKHLGEFRVNLARRFEEQKLHSQYMENQMLEMKEILISMAERARVQSSSSKVPTQNNPATPVSHAAHQVFDETPKSANTIEIDDTESMEQEESIRDEPIVVDELLHQVALQVLEEMSQSTKTIEVDLIGVLTKDDDDDDLLEMASWIEEDCEPPTYAKGYMRLMCFDPGGLLVINAFSCLIDKEESHFGHSVGTLIFYPGRYVAEVLVFLQAFDYEMSAYHGWSAKIKSCLLDVLKETSNMLSCSLGNTKPDEEHKTLKVFEGVFINPAFIGPFGLTLIEAVAYGLPIVATRNGGPVDIIKTLDNGLLIDPHDEKSIADALLKLVADKQLWARCRQNGMRNICPYSWTGHCKKYLSRISSCKPRDTGGEESEYDSPGNSLRDIHDLSLNLKLSLDGDKNELGAALDEALDAEVSAIDAKRKIGNEASKMLKSMGKGKADAGSQQFPAFKRRMHIFVIVVDSDEASDSLHIYNRMVDYIVVVCFNVWVFDPGGHLLIHATFGVAENLLNVSAENIIENPLNASAVHGHLDAVFGPRGSELISRDRAICLFNESDFAFVIPSPCLGVDINEARHQKIKITNQYLVTVAAMMGVAHMYAQWDALLTLAEFWRI